MYYNSSVEALLTSCIPLINFIHSSSPYVELHESAFYYCSPYVIFQGNMGPLFIAFSDINSNICEDIFNQLSLCFISITLIEPVWCCD